MPNSDQDEEHEEEEQLNIGTLFRYILGEEDSPIPHNQVVIGSEVAPDLAIHIGTVTRSCPLASEDEHPVNEGVSTSAGVQGHQDPHHPNFQLIHGSLRQRIGAAGYHHVLHPGLTWEDFICCTAVAVDNRFSSGRTNPLDRSVRFVKPIYSSFVNLLDFTISNTSSSSHHSARV